jgi:holo-[acyl-carrier protein] synthase
MGVDFVGVERIAELLSRHESRFLERCFTPAEQAYADANPKRRTEHLAARFAAKEAVLKALGTGWSGGIGWTDVEVTRNDAGRPGVSLSGRAADIARERGITSWHLSLSHADGYALASAVAEAP